MNIIKDGRKLKHLAKKFNFEYDKEYKSDDFDYNGFAENMHCDNTGYCAGATCKNYYNCHK